MPEQSGRVRKHLRGWLVSLLAFCLVQVAAVAQNQTQIRWEIPLAHQSVPQSKDLDAPIARLTVELTPEALVLRADLNDQDPASLRGARTAPDGFSDSDTHFIVFIDANGDGQFAQVFGLNVASAIQDGVYRASTKSQDTGVDLVWTGTSALTPNGWRAEFRIPLKSLQISAKSALPPRIYAEYYRVGDTTELFTTHDTGADGGCLLCKAPVLTGFSAQAAQYPVWRVRPTAAFQSTQTSPAPLALGRESSTQYGLDFSVQASPGWTVAGTWHPNFSDREPDQPAFTKDAQFSSWQSETRQFFVHGADIFQAQNIINTRQIANPSFAVQATERSDAFTSRWLLAQDMGGGTVIIPGLYGNGVVAAPKSSNFIGRGIVPFGGNDVGFVLTDRDFGAGKGASQVLALDTHQKFAGDAQFNGMLAFSQTSACVGDGMLRECPRQSGHSIFAQAMRGQDLLDVGFTFEEVSPGFRSDLGWQSQSGYRFFDLWWWPSVSKDLPAWLARIDWQPEIAVKTDSNGRAKFEWLNFGSKWTLKSGPVIALGFAPVSRHRLSADQAMSNERGAEVSATVSPSRVWQKSMVGLALGEMSDFANVRAGHGYSVYTDQVLAIGRAVSVHLNGRWTSTRAVDAAVSGPTIREGVALLTANYQYESFSRVRWATQWNRYLGWDLNAASISGYAGSNVTHSAAWIHEPRTGLGYSVSLSHQSNLNISAVQNTTLLTVKAGYAL